MSGGEVLLLSAACVLTGLAMFCAVEWLFERRMRRWK